MEENKEQKEETLNLPEHTTELVIVTPTTVKGKIDYNKLSRDFGAEIISNDLLKDLQSVTKVPKLHHFLTRKLFYSHRDLKQLLDKSVSITESGETKFNFYLYTGRGPSSEALHLGHMIPFYFTKYLQKLFNVPLIIQITDDEKFFFRDLNWEELKIMAWENIRDIIAVGFDVNKTFIMLDSENYGLIAHNMIKIQRAINLSDLKAIFGFGSNDNQLDNCGKIAFPAIQATPSFASSFPGILFPKPEEPEYSSIVKNADKNKNKNKNKKISKNKNPAGKGNELSCLIPCAIDQDPYFRLTRDVAHKLGYKKPALIHSKFLPSLLGIGGADKGQSAKMSASEQTSAIFMTDTPEAIKKKINKYCYSGGRDNIDEQKKYGANLDVDVAFQYLSVFLEDDEKLEEIRRKYGSNSNEQEHMSTGEVKKILIDIIQKMVRTHQQQRELVTDDVIRQFMTARRLY